jgi:hypothetical protein
MTVQVADSFEVPSDAAVCVDALDLLACACWQPCGDADAIQATVVAKGASCSFELSREHTSRSMDLSAIAALPDQKARTEEYRKKCDQVLTSGSEQPCREFIDHSTSP